MLCKIKNKKINFLKILLKKKKKILYKSIIHNNELNQKIKIFYKLNLYWKKKRKNCMLGLKSRYIDKKSNFSRFAINKFNSCNENLNYTIFNK